MPESDHYILISADAHAGADLRAYKDYLESRYHDDFEQWAASMEEGARVMRETMKSLGMTKSVGVDGDPEIDADRNWNSDRRLREQEADGWVAEVIFPNTQPPFAPMARSQLEAPPVGNDNEHRWAGLRAHNRWLVDYVSLAPERRAGCAQIFLADIEGTVKEIEWAAEHGLRGGIVLPGAPPGSGFLPLYAAEYESIWAACEANEMPVNHHSGGGTPDFGMHPPASTAMFMLEVTWWAHRPLWHLMFSGVFERHPDLHFCNTESGTKWVLDTLPELDSFYERMKYGHGSEVFFGGAATKDMSLRPSEYWHRQCHIGASFLRPRECDLRHEVGIDNIMWGVDYPHNEGSQPYTRVHLRRTFAGVPPAEVEQMVTLNAAKLYKFDLDALAPIAEKVGPTTAEVFEPFPWSDVPDEAKECPGLHAENQRELVS
jgi:predicted TIM-barrel fold metal-dependent hydrolase